MKPLFVSLLLFTITLVAQAETVDFKERQSKKLYNILADLGLKSDFPAEKQTRQWAKPAVCVKESAAGATAYGCQIHDQLKGESSQSTGSVAKKLYDFLVDVNGANCEDGVCVVVAPDIQCAYSWSDQNGPFARRYRCAVEKRN